MNHDQKNIKLCFYMYRYPSDKQQIMTTSKVKDLTILKNAVCMPLLITDSALLQQAMNYLNDNESLNYLTTTHQ